MDERLSERELSALGEENEDAPVQRSDEGPVPVAESRRNEVPDAAAEASPLLSPDEAADLRARWQDLRARFVDDPNGSVTAAEELVSGVVKKIELAWAQETGMLAAGANGGAEPSTEDLRIAMQRYRASSTG
jgi:hypothetical protein